MAGSDGGGRSLAPGPASRMAPTAGMDQHGRVIDYLRISITDRCNERCLYCMPQGYKGWSQRADHLTAVEIIRVVEAAAALGFRKFRLTGGEPTLREDLLEIVDGIARASGGARVALSTNGTRLKNLAPALRAAGASSLNVSLDALDSAIYRRITGGSVQAVLEGIDTALAAGFSPVKLNCVLMRGINDGEIWPLVVYAAERNLPLRFIELMPLSHSDVLHPGNFLSVEEAEQLLASRDELRPVERPGLGWGPARYFRLRQTGATVGFIGAMTQKDFCASCNKVRLTADGKIRPCLGRHDEFDVAGALRGGSQSVEETLRAAIARKPEDHEFRGCYQPQRPMTAIGG